MTEIKRRVIVASQNAQERSRLISALAPIFSDRNETPEYVEYADYRDLKKALKGLHEDLITLVVIAGFDGHWHQIFKGLEKLAEEKVAAVMIADDVSARELGQNLGFQPIVKSDTDGVAEAARVAGIQLTKLKE